MTDLIPPTPSTARAVADIIWPTVETMHGELPPAVGAGYFVGRCSSPGSLDMQRWHADREAAIADAETTPDQPTYFALGLHSAAPTCSADTFVALGAVVADSDVAVTGPDGKIRHEGGAVNGDGAEARIAQSSMPPPALIIRTSNSDGRQAFWPLDRYGDCDDGADILAAMRARAAKAGLDTSVYNLSQWVRAGGPGCRIVHVNPRRATTVVVADVLVAEHETAVSAASKPPKMPSGRRTPGIWLGKHPQIVVDALKAVGWTGPVGKARTLSNGGTRHLFRHPTASHAKSAELVVHDDGLWFRSWSDNTDAGHGRDGKGQDGIGALATLLNVDIGGAAGWLRTNHAECATWCDEARPEPDGDDGERAAREEAKAAKVEAETGKATVLYRSGEEREALNAIHNLIDERGQEFGLYRTEEGMLVDEYVQRIDEHTIVQPLGGFLRFTKFNAKGDVINVPVPKDFRQALTKNRYELLPVLVGTTANPIVRSDGTITEAFPDTGGYDGATRLLVRCSLDLRLPAQPTSDEVRSAVRLVSGLISPYEYRNAAAYANTWGLAFVAAARTLIHGPCPIYAVSSSSPGSGKTSLMSTINAIAGGWGTNVRKRGEEFDKSFETQLRHARGLFIIIDEAMDSEKPRPIVSPALTGFSTTDGAFYFRKLGTHEMIRVAPHHVPLIGATNLAFSGDFTRRLTWIHLTDEVQWSRLKGYGINSDIGETVQEWTKRHRSEVVGALLTIVRSWGQAGAKRIEPASNTLSAFHHHATIAGLLDHIGIPGYDPVAEMEENAEQDERLEEDERLMRAIQTRFAPPLTFTAQDLMDARRSAGMGVFAAVISEVVAVPGGESARRLGDRLRYLRDRRVPGSTIVLRRVGKGRHGTLWVVEDSGPTLSVTKA